MKWKLDFASCVTEKGAEYLPHIMARIIDGLGLIRPRTLCLSFWCDACSISAKGEYNGKSQLAKFSKFLSTREIWRVERGRGLKFHDNEK